NDVYTRSLHDALPISFVVTCSAARPLPSAASRYFLGLLQESRNSLKINTYKNRISKSFRMNTYEKTGGGGLAVPKWDSLPPQMRSEEHTSELQSPYDL